MHICAKQGAALLYREDRFTMHNFKSLPLKQCFTDASTAPGALHARFAPLLADNAELTKAARDKVSTIAQIALLQPRDPAPGEAPLLVANTHLFFHPVSRGPLAS